MTFNEKHKKVLKQLSILTSEIFKNDKGEVYLYGSRARGDYREDSDWDILMLTKDGNEKDPNFINEYLFPYIKLGWENEMDINTLHYTKESWAKLKNTLFYFNVSKDSIKL